MLSYLTYKVRVPSDHTHSLTVSQLASSQVSHTMCEERSQQGKSPEMNVVVSKILPAASAFWEWLPEGPVICLEEILQIGASHWSQGEQRWPTLKVLPEVEKRGGPVNIS